MSELGILVEEVGAVSVLGVDPGKTTGLALVEFNGGTRLVEAEQLAYDDMLNDLHSWVDVATAVAIEKFIVTPRTAKLTQQPHALRVIGAFDLKCRELDVPMYERTPADAKASIPDSVLDRNLPLLGSKRAQRHARDAARHALLLIRAQGLATLA